MNAPTLQPILYQARNLSSRNEVRHQLEKSHELFMQRKSNRKLNFSNYASVKVLLFKLGMIGLAALSYYFLGT